MSFKGDRALLNNRDDNLVLTQPLQADGITHSRWGDVGHSSIIGKAARAQIRTLKGKSISASHPTLSEYVTLTPRLVTPVYPADANLIVSLLDIHAAGSLEVYDGPTLEILEAGTGHGALTLHLARAIHAANVSIPSAESSQGLSNIQSTRDIRNAVIHTIEVSSRYAEHAKKVVQGFRRGLYSNNVDFHVGNVSDWIDQQIDHRRAQGSEDGNFLAHAILDMPRSYEHVAKVASVLRAQGSLAVFNPSITQITAVVETIRKQRLPVYLDRIVELGPNMTGGKEWDIRAVRPRVLAQTIYENQPEGHATDSKPGSAEENTMQDASNEDAEKISKDEIASKASVAGEQGFEMICRPKAYARVVGGGFLGVWKKLPQREH